ncbi:MAG: hypothetical protein GY756_11840 [bacterium]|nr:hypothetical protein [bacterium]
MKIKLIILVLILSSVSIYAQYFYEDFTPTQKKDIALAYLMVSERFDEINDSAQAKKYKDMALYIYPEILSIVPEKVETSAIGPEKAELSKIDTSDKSSTIRYYFSKLLRSITTGDLKLADSLIAERLYLPEYNSGLTKRQLLPMTEEIIEEFDVTTFSPSDLYKLDTIEVVKVEEGTYFLTIEGADNKYLYTSGITFFGKIQTFRFRHFDNGWKLDKITAIF